MADVEFAPGIAIMMCAYPAAYAIGKPAAAWPAFGVLLAVVVVFSTLGVDVGYGMTAVLAVLWLCVLARGRPATAAGSPSRPPGCSSSGRSRSRH